MKSTLKAGLFRILLIIVAIAPIALLYSQRMARQGTQETQQTTNQTALEPQKVDHSAPAQKPVKLQPKTADANGR